MLLNCGVGEDSWESLGLQGDPPVHPKGNQSWIFIGRTDAEAKIPILWPPDAKSWLIWKDPDAGKDWRWKEKGITEDEMVGWHHRLNGHEFEQTPGDNEGQGSLRAAVHGVRKSQTWPGYWTTADGQDLQADSSGCVRLNNSSHSFPALGLVHSKFPTRIWLYLGRLHPGWSTLIDTPGRPVWKERSSAVMLLPQVAGRDAWGR